VIALCQVLDENDNEVVAIMQSGSVFGQGLLIYDFPCFNSIRCKSNCEIFMLNNHNFRQLLLDYPQGEC